MRLIHQLLKIICLAWLLVLSGQSFAADNADSVFAESPVLLPDLRPKYDLLCGNNTSAQTLDLVDLNADGRKDILVGLWCGVPSGTETHAPTIGGLVAFTQNTDKTFVDSTMSLFGSELVAIEKPFENIVYDFNNDGYEDVFMTMSREDGRANPWDLVDNIKNAVVMSNGDGSYSLLRTGCILPCGTGYLVYEMDNESSGIDIVTAPIGYGGSREVWRYSDTWQRLSTLSGDLASGAMVFFKRTASELASLRLSISYRVNGVTGIRLFKRADQLSDWIEKDAWNQSFDNVFSAPVANWNGDISTWPITVSDGEYYAGGTFEYGCEMAVQSDSNLNLVYLETAYQLDDYVEGVDIVEGQGMRWVYRLFGFSATDTSLTPEPIELQGSVDLTDRPYRMSCEDVNGDGRDDIVVATWGYETHPHVYINIGENKFSLIREEMWPPMADALKNSQPVYADVDGDDIPDVIYFSGASVAYSNSPEIRYEVHFATEAMAVEDTYDSDSDGVLNDADAFPLDSTETVDSDTDGVGDNSDVFPLNSLYSADNDTDGMPNTWETQYGLNPNDATDATSDQDNDGANALTEFLAGTIPVGSLDIDGSGDYDALTDGLLLLRQMFGLTGDGLVGGAIAADALYSSSTNIEGRITMLGSLADIDGNGSVDALTDGLLALRYLFGLKGDALISGVIAADATRASSAEIEAHIQSLTPAL